MLNIIIICVGSVKESFWREAISEYTKRLSPYAKIEIKEIPEEKISKITDRQRILKIEGEKISKAIPDRAFIVALERNGVTFNSVEWAKKLDEWSLHGQQIVFIIGGPLGLYSEILKRAAVLLSFSKMTFTHQMSQIVLLEQIYRGVMITRGKIYHY
ncbi:MAG: 23S rRNA (pseudouridine(1915)-N(3))-methyltransferase RlmH [Patescibacteria group bacterium]|jgi:23S rRNA (pseudouridine1915-N3)-methyltransferase